MVRGILSGRELGSVEDNGGVWAESGWMLVVEEWRWIAGCLGVVGEGFARVWEAEMGLVSGEGMLNFQKGGGREFWLLTLSL